MTDRVRARRLAGALTVGLFALFPRLCNLRGTFLDDRILFGGFDSWYHMRRIEHVLATGSLPYHDAYLNHPTGAPVDWPPGFDLLMATLYRVVSVVLPDSVSPGAVAAVVVPLLGVATALAVMALAAKLWSWRVGAVAGLIVAGTAANIDYTTVGRVDHHAVEPLLMCGLLAAAAWAWATPERRLRQVVLGASMALAPAFWPGAIVFAIPLVAAAAFSVLRGHRGAPLLLALGVATVLSALLGMTTPWGADGKAVYYALSWFQPAVFAGSALGLAALSWGTPRARRWGGGQRLVAALALIAIGGVVLAATPAGPAFERAFAYLFKSEAQISNVAESVSPMKKGLGFFLRWFSPLVLALPIALAWGVRREWAGASPSRVATLAAVILPGGLGFVQTRFVPIAMIPISIAIAVLIVEVGQRLRGPSPPNRAVAWLVWTLVVGSLSWSALPFLDWTPDVSPNVIRSMDSLTWLGAAAPETSGFQDDQLQPEYGVLSSWTLGHHVVYVGRKPNVANPLGQTDANLGGLHRAAAIQLSGSAREATELVDASDIRYLLLTPLHEDLDSLTSNTGRAPSEYLLRPPGAGRQLTPEYFATFHSRLYLDDGRAESFGGASVAPVPGFRLVQESRATVSFMGRSMPYSKIFERVKGATLTGECPPGEPAEAVVEVVTSRRRFVWTGRSIADAAGRFAISAPYATEPRDVDVTTSGPWRVRCADERWEVEVSERAVLFGETLDVHQ